MASAQTVLMSSRHSRSATAKSLSGARPPFQTSIEWPQNVDCITQGGTDEINETSTTKATVLSLANDTPYASKASETFITERRIMADNASSTPNIATGTPNVATGTPNVASNTPTLVKEIVKGVTVVTHPPAFSTKMTAKEAEDKACE